MSSSAATFEPAAAARRMKPVSQLNERIFSGICAAMASAVIVLVALVGYQLWKGAGTTFHTVGASFLTKSTWDPNGEAYGALPFIFGTLVTSLLGLFIATPLAVATAVFLTELAPNWLRQPLIFLIEMLAAIPSVILGLWAIFILLPFLNDHIFPVLAMTHLPIFSGVSMGGYSVLAGALIIAVMVLPIITSVSREILRSVPDLQREAAYGLGATRWEVTRIAVLSYAKKGIFGATILGLGRALGETMAITMVIGNANQISASLFAPGNTLASVIASQFNEASSDSHRDALIAVGFVLFAITLVINLCARLLLKFGTADTGAVQ